MAKVKTVRVNTVKELAKALGLTPAEGAEIAFRTNLNSEIIKIVKKKKITHEQLAKLAGSSRTRMTALLNRNISDVSTDLMLRVLSSLGYKTRLKIIKAA
ncbi:MAG: XRE family transcriptional regulator [Bdellovibrionales bacterium]|nr:XRE family transcriptional regulator [Bdellovibrionales bacterium]